MKCYGLGLALNTWKVVALTEHFRKLEMDHLEKSYATCAPPHCIFPRESVAPHCVCSETTKADSRRALDAMSQAICSKCGFHLRFADKNERCVQNWAWPAMGMA